MVRIKIIQEGLVYPVGKILNVSKEEGEEAVEHGSAELINETYVKGVGYVETKEVREILNPKIPARDLELCLKQFTEFYDLLMKEAPKDYTPWFFPCAKNGKNPSTEAILKLDNSSKGSWHHENARVTKQKALALIRQGYNIGISAREGDKLVIIDIDEEEFLNQVPKDTLTVTSRKVAGLHAFCWDKDGTAKINLPTDNGEIRSLNQYVLACGSYVPFNFKSERDIKAFDKLPKYAKENINLGHYCLREKKTPRDISFDELPDFFKQKELENIKTEANIKQRTEIKDYVKNNETKEGKYTELFKLKVSDIVGLIPSSKREGHPLHESDTDANFSLSKDGAIGHCWRHMVSLNTVQYLCVKSGYAKCEDAGTPHKNRGISKIKGDKKALENAYNEAVKMELIKKYVGSGETNKRKGHIVFDRITQIQEFHNNKPFFYDKNKIWWLWEAEKFKYIKSDDVEILGFNYEDEGSDIVKSKERTEIINALKHIGRKNMPKESKESWVQFKDLIIDLETDEEFKASPKYFMTNPIDYELGESEETPTFDKLFGSWVGEENKIELYEILAFAQAPKYFIHRIICLIGSGSNGKSTFLSILRNYLGLDNIVSSSLENLMSVRFEGSKLYKKLVCLMGETNFGTLKSTDYIKGLSGEDYLRVEFKGKDSFDTVNYAKLILATNSLPQTADKTDGFYRRWKILNFNNKFNIEKDVLSEIPKEEYQNLALKLLNLLKGLWKNRIFTNDGGFEERKQKYEAHSNPIMLFIKENYVKDVNSEILAENFREVFEDFLQEKGFRGLSPRAITQQLNLNGFEVKQIKKLGINKKYILGLKERKVTEVTEVTDIIVHSPCVIPVETSVTSVTSVTDPPKEINKNDILFDKVSGLSEEKDQEFDFDKSNIVGVYDD